MRSFRLSGPSPAMVVACVALSFALAGSAVAGTDALNRAITKSKVKKIAKKQAKKQLRKNVSGSHVNRADNATNATNATNAANATNADMVDGFHANQLARGTTATATGAIDDFDAAAFTDLISRSVEAPTAGIILISGQVNVNRDAGTATPALLQARGAVDGAAATTEANVRATETGTVDQSVSVSGAVPVAAGTHTVALQAQEVSAGRAFLTERSVTTLFVPFGNAGAIGALSRSRDLSGAGDGNK